MNYKKICENEKCRQEFFTDIPNKRCCCDLCYHQYQYKKYHHSYKVAQDKKRILNLMESEKQKSMKADDLLIYLGLR
jgi:hypothetical protein